MEFVEVYKYIGQMSWYQLRLYFCIGFTAFLLGMQNFSAPFTGMEQSHWCKVESLSTLSYQQQKELAIPWNEDNNDYDRCYMFEIDWNNMTDVEIKALNRSDVENTPVTACRMWVHDTTEFRSTIITQWELVCSRGWLVEFASTVYLLGLVLGSLVSGPIADRFGRKTCMLIFVLTAIPAGFGAAFSPSLILYLILRCLVSLSTIAAHNSGFVLSMELIGPKYRTIAGVCYHTFFAVGYMSTPWLAAALRDYSWFLVALSLPYILGLILCLIPPESPRWLLTVNQKDKALKILDQMAKHNGQTLPDNFLQKDDVTGGQGGKESHIPVTALFTNGLLRKYLLTNLFQWTAISVIYWAIGLNIGNLTGNIYLNGFLMGLIEVPAHIICFLMMGVIGRRWSLVGSMFLCAFTSLISVPLTATGVASWLVTALAVIGKGAMASAFAVVYLFTAEVFPTSLRQVAIGSASTLAKVGSLGSPYMGGPLQSVWLPLPSLVFGVLSIVAGSLTVLLPETLGCPLPDTMEDVEKLVNKGSQENPEIGMDELATGKDEENGHIGKY